MGDSLQVDVGYSRGATFVLSARFTAPPGITAIRGPSGAGKTTLLKLIAGLLAPTSGTIALGAQTWASPNSWLPPERRRASMLFQSLALFPHLTVLENVQFGLGRRADSVAVATAALERTHAAPLAARMPSTLSAGEAQRVALARAIAPTPAVLLLDEPLSSLDDALRLALREELRTLTSSLSIPVLMATHDAGDLALANTVLHLDHGALQLI